MQAVHVSRSAFRGWILGVVMGTALIIAVSFGLGLTIGPATVERAAINGSSEMISTVPAAVRDDPPLPTSGAISATQASASSAGNSGHGSTGTQSCYPDTVRSVPGERDVRALESMLAQNCGPVSPEKPR
jgi:hypothetical protein